MYLASATLESDFWPQGIETTCRPVLEVSADAPRSPTVAAANSKYHTTAAKVEEHLDWRAIRRVG
jgi:hypothetical protein